MKTKILADFEICISVPLTQSRKKRKKKLNFYFTLLYGASKGFMKALKVFIKPFEAPQRSVKIKI